MVTQVFAQDMIKTGGQLFGNYIKWFLLTIITLGIYSLWLSIKMKQWVTKHTHMVYDRYKQINQKQRIVD